MKRFFFAVFCILAFARAAPSHAQEWVAAATDAAKVRYDLDISSIKMNGGYSTAWMRVVEPKDLVTPTTRKAYRTVTIQWLDNCVNQTFAATESIYLDSSNVVVDTQITPQEQWQFIAIPPGSIVEAMQKQICTLAAYRATLKPAIDPGTLNSASWQSASYDPANKIDYYVDTQSVSNLQSGIIDFISRNVARSTTNLPDGTPYKTAIIFELGECKTEKIAFESVDYYDSVGTLVSTVKLQAQDTPTPTVAAPGSVNELELRLACGQTTASASPAGQPQLVSGTAWLEPKGYLITADHVVAGATKLLIGQDGKAVGTADIVLEDAANDVAVLRPHFTVGGHTAIALGEVPAMLGEKVFTLGFPDPSGMGLSIKMTSGEVSATAGDDPTTSRVDDPRLLQISIPVQPGNSGGPVIDASGHAVGVVLSRLERTGSDQIAENVNYALKVGYVQNLLAGLPDVGAPHWAVKPGPIVSVVAGVQGAVFLIVAAGPQS